MATFVESSRETDQRSRIRLKKIISAVLRYGLLIILALIFIFSKAGESRARGWRYLVWRTG